MILYAYILIICSTNLYLTSGSRVRKLDQVELDEDDYNNGHYLLASERYAERREVVKSAETCNSDYKNQLHIQSYVKRYVNTFMRHTDFKNVDTSTLGFDDFVYGKLNIRMKASHLEELKKIYFEDKPISLPDLDSYLSGMFYNSRFEEFEGYFYKIFQLPIPLYSFLIDKLNIVVSAYILVGLAFLYCWHKRGFPFAILILLVGLAAIESINKYYVALKKAEIEQFRRLKQLKDVSPTCDPSTYSYFRTFRNLFYEDECQQLLEDLQIPHVMMVSFNQCLLESFLHLYFEMPITSVAHSSRVTVSAIIGKSSFAWILEPIVTIVIFIILLVGVMILLGANFSFSNWIIGRFSVGFRRGNVFNSTQNNSPGIEDARRDFNRAASTPNIYLNVNFPNQLNSTQGNTFDSITYQPNSPVIQNVHFTPLLTNDPTQIQNQSQNRPGNTLFLTNEPVQIEKQTTIDDNSASKSNPYIETGIETASKDSGVGQIHKSGNGSEVRPKSENENIKKEEELFKDIIEGLLNKLKVSDENELDKLNDVNVEKQKMGNNVVYSKNNGSDNSSSSKDIGIDKIHESKSDVRTKNENIDEKLIKDIIEEILVKLKVNDENVRDKVNSYVNIKKQKKDNESVDSKYNDSANSLSITHDKLGSKKYDSNDESFVGKNKSGSSSIQVENSDGNEEELGAHFEIVGSTEKLESHEEKRSDVDVQRVVDCESAIGNISNTSSELDLGAEVETIKSGLRSLIDEDDFVNIQ